MKKTITIITLIIGFAISATAATSTIETPVEVEFANKLVGVFGGSDMTLSEAELIRVVKFLQTKLPEQTGPTSMTNRLSRQNNFYNAPRGILTEERNSVREEEPERIAAAMIKKFDSDSDKQMSKNELALVMSEVIGTPKKSGRIASGSVAKN